MLYPEGKAILRQESEFLPQLRCRSLPLHKDETMTRLQQDR
jgi:hypothetical protein